MSVDYREARKNEHRGRVAALISRTSFGGDSMTVAGPAERYEGKILRVDLTSERVSDEKIEEATLKAYLGGTGLGARVSLR